MYRIINTLKYKEEVLIIFETEFVEVPLADTMLKVQLGQ